MIWLRFNLKNKILLLVLSSPFWLLNLITECLLHFNEGIRLQKSGRTKNLVCKGGVRIKVNNYEFDNYVEDSLQFFFKKIINYFNLIF